MNHICYLATFLSISLLAFSSQVFGLAGDLDAPSLSFPADSKIQKGVMSVISDKKFKFLRGHFINAYSTLTFFGDAASLNAFLFRLSQCEGSKVSVTFSKEEGDMSWTLTHSAWGSPDAFNIAVNTAQIAEAATKVPK